MAARRAQAAFGSTANLFSAAGKMPVSLIELGAEGCSATLETPPPLGSVAVLARNGVRTFATVACVDGVHVTLAFDQPLADWQRDWLLGVARPRITVGLQASEVALSS